MDDTAAGANITSIACADEPADPTPTEEQCMLQGSDNSMGFKTQGANVSLCDAEKHAVQSTECESDSEYTDEVNLLKGELKILTSGEHHSATLSNR